MSKKGQLIGVGRSAMVYEWGEHEVIKVFHDRCCALEEAQNSEIITSLEVRAPRYCGMIERDGNLCIIYEKIQGTTMLWLIKPTKESIIENAKLMANLHNQIHQVRINAKSNLKQQLQLKIHQNGLLEENDKQRILHRLEQLPDGSELCHYDFHPDNIMISKTGPMIIDWLNALIGNRLADVARTEMMLGSSSLPPVYPEWLKKRELRKLFRNEYLNAYEKISRVERKEIDDWKQPTLAIRITELTGEEQKEIIDELEKELKNW